MKISVTVNNAIPTKHAHRVIYPKVEVEDIVLPGEGAMEAGRRIGIVATALFAREVLDQLRFTDRMAHTSTEQWCDEYLSTVSEDHPAMKAAVAPETLPTEIRKMFHAMAELLGEHGAQKFIEVLQAAQHPVPPVGA